jgi:hypothetical protein
MTQKQALANLLRTISWKPARYQLVSNWLEDINWHTENGMLCDRVPDVHKEMLEKLQHFDYASRPCKYSYQFIQGLKIKGELDEYKQAVEQFNTGSYNGGVIIEHELFDRMSIYDFQKAQDSYSVFACIFGWGLKTKEWGNTSGIAFVLELIDIIEDPDSFKEV